MNSIRFGVKTTLGEGNKKCHQNFSRSICELKHFSLWCKQTVSGVSNSIHFKISLSRSNLCKISVHTVIWHFKQLFLNSSLSTVLFLIEFLQDGVQLK